MAARLLPLVGAPTSTTDGPTIDWTAYQGAGLKPLPQSSESIDTSFAAAFSGEEGMDRGALITAFQAMMGNASSTREERLKAVGGLALMGQPVLPSLQAAASQTDLSWNEQAILLKAFVAMGDREDAKHVFDLLMAQTQEADGRLFVNVDRSDEKRFEATRVAAYAAIFLADDRAEKMVQYVVNLSLNHQPFDPILDVRLLQLRIAQAPQETAKVTYRVGDQVQSADLKDGSVWIPLTAATWNLFSIDQAEGPVTVQWNRRAPGVPAATPGLSIARTYAPAKPGVLHEGDSVQVTLTPTIADHGSVACYEIRDRLPANLRPLIDWNYTDAMWSPVTSSNGEMHYTTCANYQQPITYTAQVITPGVFVAPAPILQNIDQPSLAAIGVEQMVTSTKR